MRPYILTNALGYTGTIYVSRDGSVTVNIQLPNGSYDMVTINSSAKIFKDSPGISDIDLFDYVVNLIHTGTNSNGVTIVGEC